MKALLQRVSEASVTVDERTVGAINDGLLVFIGVEPEDTEKSAQRMVDRLLRYRVFSDADGRMNLSLQDTGGGLLLVSQFTLAADTRKGNRPGFSTAAPPAQAEALFHYLVEQARHQLEQNSQQSPKKSRVATGEFAAHMQVQLVNDGPVTILLEA